MNQENKQESPAQCPFDTLGYSMQKPAFIECLFIESFEVDYDLGIHMNYTGYPTPSNRITMKGRPASQGSNVVKAELYFRDDQQALEKPSYDQNTKCIKAYYKLSAFDQIRNMLHVNPNNLHFHYYEEHTSDPDYVIHVQFYEYGKIIR